MSTTSIQQVDREDERVRRYEEMDTLDTAQIIAELKGEVSEEYFYTIKDAETGKEQPGLSWAGTKWIASQMAVGRNPHPLSIEHVEITDSPDGMYYRAIATVKDLATQEKRTGIYEQSKFRRKNVWDGKHKKIGEELVMVDIYDDGQKVGREPARDPHAYTVVGSKAARNGMRHFMPEPVILSMYQAWKDKRSPGAKKDETRRESPASQPQKVTLEEVSYALRDFGVVVDQEGKTIRVRVDGDIGNEEYVQIYDLVTEKYRGTLVTNGKEKSFDIKAE